MPYTTPYKSPQGHLQSQKYPMGYQNQPQQGHYQQMQPNAGWHRSYSAGSIGHPTPQSQYSHQRTVSSSRISSYSGRIRPSGYNETHSAWQTPSASVSAPSISVTATTASAAPVPDRYHRAKPTTMTAPSLSPSTRSVDVDSNSTQTSESSLSSWPDDEKTPNAKAALTAAMTAAAPAAASIARVETTTTSLPAILDESTPQDASNTVTVSPSKSEEALHKTRSASISPRSSPVKRSTSPSPSLSRHVEAPPLETAQVTLTSGPKISRPSSRAQESSARPRSPGPLVLPSDSRPRTSFEAPVATLPTNKTPSPTKEQGQSRPSSIRSLPRPYSMADTRSITDSRQQRRLPTQHRDTLDPYARRSSASSIHARHASDELTSNRPVDPQTWRSSVPAVQKMPAGVSPRVGSISQSPQSSQAVLSPQPPQTPQPSQQVPRVPVPASPAPQTTRTVPSIQSLRPEPEPEKKTFGSRLKSFFGGGGKKKETPRDNSDTVSVMSGTSGISGYSTVSTKSTRSTFSLRGLGKKVFRKESTESLSVYSTAQSQRRGSQPNSISHAIPQSPRPYQPSKPTRASVYDFSSRTYANSAAQNRMSHQRKPSNTSADSSRRMSLKLDEESLPDSSITNRSFQPPVPNRSASSSPAVNAPGNNAASTIRGAGVTPISSLQDVSLTPVDSGDGEEVVDLAATDTVFPRNLDDQGVATIRAAVERVASLERKLSRHSSRRGRVSEKEREEEKVPNAHEVHATTSQLAASPSSVLSAPVIDFSSDLDLALDLDLGFKLDPPLLSAVDLDKEPEPVVKEVSESPVVAPAVPGKVPTFAVPPISMTAKASVQFASQIMVYDTYSCIDYDRRPEPATCNRLTPMLAQQIKHELNSFKLNMDVHRDSRAYTHFF